jgi:hypothetical protein
MSEEPVRPDPEPVPSGEPDQPGAAPRSPEGPDSPSPPREPGGGEQDPSRPQLDERARALGPGADRQDEGPEVAAGAETRLDGSSENTRSQARRLRDDIPRTSFSFGGETTVGDIAGRDIRHYHTSYNFTAGGRAGARGPVSVSELTRVALVHVRTDSDVTVRERCDADRVIILRGRLESGRRSSAVSVLDALTGTAREQSLVSVVEAAAGLVGLAGRLAEGHGHLLDASGGDWLEEISEAQLGEIRSALEQKQGYLIVLATTDASPPPHVTPVEHEPPDPAKVIRSHLAAYLTTGTELTAADFTAAEALLRAALDASAEARQWEEELARRSAPGTTAAPAEAAHLAAAITEWARARDAGQPSSPRITHYRNLRLHGQVRALLGRGDQTDSPLRQAYVIATAALDHMPVSDVADQARELAVLLDKAEGGSKRRRLFAETLTHWMGHAEVAAAVPEGGGRDPGVEVVRLPSRRLARTIVEIAWSDYDAAREPVRTWLVGICGEHQDPRVRVRAAQALGYIAIRDYAYIKNNVLNPWSESKRAIEHQAAAWLLEAAVVADGTDGSMKRRVEKLLEDWSRRRQWQKRAIAVRTYGTRIGVGIPEAARAGIRFSAADPDFGLLPELALTELYAGGQQRLTMRELDAWSNASPVIRERVGGALVMISLVRQDDQPEYYDLLWRMAHRPASAGVDLDTLGRLWKLACVQEGSSGAAWKMLGLWAKSSRRDPAQRDAFKRLADIFEEAMDRGHRKRVSVHRRQWDDYPD